VQTAETFKVKREILTCWLLLKKFSNHVKPLLLLRLFLLGAKRFTIINVVHFLKKPCIVAFSVRKLIFLTKFSVWTVSRLIVFLGWYQDHGLGKRV